MKKYTRREMFKDSAKVLGGMIMIVPAMRALGQTSNPSPLNLPPAPETANPTELDPSQNPAQNRIPKQYKRGPTEAGTRGAKTMYKAGKAPTGYHTESYYQTGYYR